MKIGFVGIGTMGYPMSSNLLKKTTHTIVAFDVHRDAVLKLVKLGAVEAGSAIEVASQCDIVFSMLPKSEHVQAVYKDFINIAKEEQIFVDMSTIDPSVSIELSKSIADKNAIMLDAPVVKSQVAAIDGTLGIYVGGNEDAYKKVHPLLECIGNNIIHLGANGRGLVMKIIHNSLVAQIQNGVNEMMVFAESSDINIHDFIKAISYGGGQNFYLDTKGKSIYQGNYKSAFSVQNMHKDLHIARNMIKEENLTLPIVDYVAGIYDKAMSEGYGSEDFSASFKVVKKNS